MIKLKSGRRLKNDSDSIGIDSAGVVTEGDDLFFYSDAVPGSDTPPFGFRKLAGDERLELATIMIRRWERFGGLDSTKKLPVSVEGVPFVQLGAGEVLIGDTYAKDGSYSGVSFTKSEPCEIGSAHPETFGKTSGEIGSFLGIFATNPKSLQVLIDKLTLARDNFGIKHPAEVSHEAKQANGDGNL